MQHIQTQSEWEAGMADKVLELVRSEIYLELRFLDIGLSALVPCADEGVRTFATDGSHLHYSSEQVLRVFQNNPKFLNRAVLHSLFHCIFAHLWLGGNREVRSWNLACDIAVEYTIDTLDKQCTRRILTWQRQRWYETLLESGDGISAAVIYRRLLSLTENELRELEQEFYTDDHRYWPRQEESAVSLAKHPMAKHWNQIARQMKFRKEQNGSSESEADRLLSSQLAASKSRRNYRDFLRHFTVLREELHCDPDEFDLHSYTYGLRLYGNMPLVEPVETRETRKIQELLIVLDTSDSTSGQLVESFLRETFQILSQREQFFHRCCLRILQCDNQVRAEHVITDAASMEQLLEGFTIYGGGGTDFRPAFTYVEELLAKGVLKHPGGLLYFTDGIGTYPKKRPEYPVAFLFLEDYDEEAIPPWAMRIRLEPEEFSSEVLSDADLSRGGRKVHEKGREL